MTREPASPGADVGPFRHAAAIYDSDEAFLAAVIPFIGEATGSGEPVILALTAGQQALLASTTRAQSGVSVLARGEHYAHPLDALRANQALFEGHLRTGARRVRLVGDLPHDDATTWPGWVRYEALCNHQFADLPVSALCTYDSRDTSQAALADVRRVHPLLADADGAHVPNPDYLDPASLLAGWSQTAPGSLEATEPDVTMLDPSPAEGRRAVAAMAALAGVADDGLVAAISEVVTNAHRHGRPPVTFRAWRAPGLVVATVTDAGPGPADPFAGLLPPSIDTLGGRGLWICNQLCDSFSISVEDDQCVVRMVGQAPPTG